MSLQASQERKPAGSASPRFLFHVLTTSFCPDFPQLWTVNCKYKYNKSFPSVSCFLCYHSSRIKLECPVFDCMWCSRLDLCCHFSNVAAASPAVGVISRIMFFWHINKTNCCLHDYVLIITSQSCLLGSISNSTSVEILNPSESSMKAGTNFLQTHVDFEIFLKISWISNCVSGQSFPEGSHLTLPKSTKESLFYFIFLLEFIFRLIIYKSLLVLGFYT